MKTNFTPILIIIILALCTIIVIQCKENNDLISLEPVQVSPTFIWNDDLEGLPADGTPVLLQYTSNDTIYLSVIENLPSSEYQFTVTDDSISVSDFDRTVGTVKIEGQLRDLITKDNQ